MFTYKKKFLNIFIFGCPLLNASYADLTITKSNFPRIIISRRRRSFYKKNLVSTVNILRFLLRKNYFSDIYQT